MTEEEMRCHIKKLVALCGSQRNFASKYGISPQYTNDVIHGNRHVTAQVAEKLGFRRVVSFERKETND